jgi:glycosyltransferase involved in cell wall biosynthesis
MKKNIIFFLHNLNVGGAEKNFINYANYLSNNNINVKIICLSAKGILKKNIDKKVKVIDLNKKRLKNSIFPILKIINSTKPDILFSSLLHISLLLCLFKKMNFIKAKLFIRPSNVLLTNQISTENKPKYLIILLTKFFLKYADLFFCISDNIFKELQLFKIPTNKIIKINNAIVDEDFYKKSKKPLKNTKRLNKTDYILSIGRLTEQKNHMMLLNSFIQIKKKYKKKLFLVLIGEGHLKKHLKNFVKINKIEKDVIFLKNLQNVLNYIKSCKLFVQTSLWEGQPNVLIEALLLNKQVIATNCPGQTKKNLEHFKNCHLLKFNSINNLSKTILFFLDKKKKTFRLNKTINYSINNSSKIILDAIKKN